MYYTFTPFTDSVHPWTDNYNSSFFRDPFACSDLYGYAPRRPVWKGSGQQQQQHRQQLKTLQKNNNSSSNNDSYSCKVDLSGWDVRDVRVTAEAKSNSATVELLLGAGGGRRVRRSLQVPMEYDVTRVTAELHRAEDILVLTVPKKKTQQQQQMKVQHVREQQQQKRVPQSKEAKSFSSSSPPSSFAPVEVVDLGEDSQSDSSSVCPTPWEGEPLEIVGLQEYETEQEKRKRELEALHHSQKNEE